MRSPLERLIEGQVARDLLRSLKPYRKKVLTECTQAPFPFRIVMETDQVSGEVTGRKGDYICRNAAGGWYPVPKQTFEFMYEEAPNE